MTNKEDLIKKVLMKISLKWIRYLKYIYYLLLSLTCCIFHNHYFFSSQFLKEIQGGIIKQNNTINTILQEVIIMKNIIDQLEDQRRPQFNLNKSEGVEKVKTFELNGSAASLGGSSTDPVKQAL